MPQAIEHRELTSERQVASIQRIGPEAQYFYFFMSSLIAAVVAFGFGRTVGPRLLHTIYPKPLLLSVHAAVFSAWICFYVLQSALVRTGNVRLHRMLGPFGVLLGTAIPVIGTVTAVVMRRFDLQYRDLARTAPLLRTALLDLASFTLPFALAICWRKRPEFHRRLIFVASAGLTAAAFVRFPAMFHPWPYYYVGVDALVFLGVLRDLFVNRRIHAVYLCALPTLVLAQLIVMDTILHFWLL
jgi:hypothetical protein